MRRSLLLIFLAPFLLLGVQACGPKMNKQDDCGFVQNVYGERISWKESVPVPLLIHESVPAAYYPVIESSIRTWEAAMGRPLFKIVGYGAKLDGAPKQDGLNVIYWLESWEENKSSEQGRTSVYWVSDTIKEADIRINAKDFSFYIQSPTSAHDVHFESLIIHELGHVLGLKHNEAEFSVMRTYLASQTARDLVTDSDRLSLLCEY